MFTAAQLLPPLLGEDLYSETHFLEKKNQKQIQNVKTTYKQVRKQILTFCHTRQNNITLTLTPRPLLF